MKRYTKQGTGAKAPETINTTDMIIAIEYEQEKPRFSTGKETKRVTFPTFKKAFEHYEQERGEMVNWWEKQDKRIKLPHNEWRKRWVTLKKV